MSLSSRRVRAFVLLVAVASTALLSTDDAEAVTPSTSIVSGGPLTSVMLGNDLSCQVSFVGDTSLQFYPPSTIPGDCGTLIATGGVLFAPDFTARTSATSSLGPRTVFTPVSQSAVTGTGVSGDPYTVTTVADAGPGLRLTQIDSYVAGQTSYRTALTITNTTGAAKDLVVYRAGDCYLGGSDSGFGFVQPVGAESAVACSKTPDNAPSDRVEQWIPLTPGSSYYQARFYEVWDWIGDKTPFPDTCLCATLIDNGAGLSWSRSIPDGASVTISHLLNFGLSAEATTLEAHPAIAEVLPEVGVYFPMLSATLTDGDGDPIDEKSVEFYVDGAFVCAAETSPSGTAACGGVVEEIDAVLAGGFTAVFGGDLDYLASADDAPVLRVAGTDLP